MFSSCALLLWHNCFVLVFRLSRIDLLLFIVILCSLCCDFRRYKWLQLITFGVFSTYSQLKFLWCINAEHVTSILAEVAAPSWMNMTVIHAEELTNGVHCPSTLGRFDINSAQKVRKLFLLEFLGKCVEFCQLNFI